MFVNFHKVSKKILGLKESNDNAVLKDMDGAFYLKHSPAMDLVK